MLSILRRSFLVLMMLCLLPCAALAAFPDRPITLILPFGAGTASERMFRELLPFLEKNLGVKVVFDFKAGGGGVVGANYYMTTKPDGYTLLAYSLPHIVLQNKFMKTGYQVNKLAPLGGFSWRPDILVVPQDAPYKNLNEMLEYARQNPGRLTIAGVGNYTSSHLTHALLSKATGIDMPRVPYDSGGKLMAAILGGQVKAAITNIQWLSTNKEKLKGIASASDKRWYEDIPTFKEEGVPLESYAGSAFLFARTETLPDVLDFLREAVAKTLADPELKKILDTPETGFYAMSWEDVGKRINELEEQAKELTDMKK